MGEPGCSLAQQPEVLLLQRWLDYGQLRIRHRGLVERGLRNLIGRARPISRRGGYLWRVGGIWLRKDLVQGLFLRGGVNEVGRRSQGVDLVLLSFGVELRPAGGSDDPPGQQVPHGLPMAGLIHPVNIVEGSIFANQYDDVLDRSGCASSVLGSSAAS